MPSACRRACSSLKKGIRRKPVNKKSNDQVQRRPDRKSVSRRLARLAQPQSLQPSLRRIIVAGPRKRKCRPLKKPHQRLNWNRTSSPSDTTFSSSSSRWRSYGTGSNEERCKQRSTPSNSTSTWLKTLKSGCASRASPSTRTTARAIRGLFPQSRLITATTSRNRLK